MSQFSISGAVSGVDTASIINSLVSVQQNQQKLLQAQQAKQQKASDTYAAMLTSLAALGAQAKTVATTADWQGATASSSSTGVTATSTGNISASVVFDVTAVAQAHSVISADTVNSLGATVASGPLTLTRSDGSTTQIDAGAGSLSDVVAAINSSASDLTAAAIRTGPGQYRLQVSSASTGAASQFTLDGLDGFSGLNVLSRGSDAEVSIGSNPLTAYTATSSTNTFDELVAGVSFTVTRVESGVTVSSAIDGSNVAKDVQSLVDSANGVLASISTATSYNASTKTGGALVGDSTARSLTQGILNLVGSARAPGVSLTRDGKLSFDQNAFVAAYKKDPAATAAKFGAGTQFVQQNGATANVTLGSATSATRAGSYAVTVTNLAQREQWEADATSLVEGSVVSLTSGSQVVKYTVAATDTPDDIASELNSRASAAGLRVSAAAGGAGLQVTADNAGTGSAFTLSVDDVEQSQVTAGADVQGTIDGFDAAGTGNVLSLSNTNSRANGLSLAVDATQDDLTASGGAIGTVSYVPGLAQRIAQFVDTQTTAVTGVVASAKSGRDTVVKAFQDQIDDWDRRLTAYRATLQTQFTAMETAIAALKSQSTAITNFSNSSSSSSSSG